MKNSKNTQLKSFRFSADLAESVEKYGNLNYRSFKNSVEYLLSLELPDERQTIQMPNFRGPKVTKMIELENTQIQQLNKLRKKLKRRSLCDVINYIVFNQLYHSDANALQQHQHQHPQSQSHRESALLRGDA